MIPKECKRLAEVDFPIAVVSKHAAREKSIRHGHPSTLHLWWARRPLAACRAMLLALLLPDPCDPHCPDDFKQKARDLLQKVPGGSGGKFHDTEIPKGYSREDYALRKGLLRFIGDFSNWDLSADQTYLEVSRGLVKAAHPEEIPLVVDPFAGGGSIPLEALRLGCEAFASDLNPVACLILKVMLEDIPRHGPELAEELRRVGAEIKAEAEKELAEFYPPDTDGSRPIAYLWARTVKCESPNCGAEIPLVRSFWLCKKATRKRALRYQVKKQKEKCKSPEIEFEIFEPKKDKDVPDGTVARAKATCLCCGSVLPPERVRAQLREQRGGADVIFNERGERIGGARLMAVATLKPGEQSRCYRLPKPTDYGAVWKARKYLDAIAAKLLPNGLSVIPNEPTPAGGGSGAGRAFSVQNYGMMSFNHLFTGRQQLAHVILSEKIRSIKNLAECKKILAMSMSKNLRHCNVLSKWHRGSETVAGAFGMQALPMSWDFPEMYPFASYAGGFDDSLEDAIVPLENITKAIKTIGQSNVADAADSPLPAETVSVWFTDPPYYDAIPYSDLSDFFFVWLKRMLLDNSVLVDLFDLKNPLTPKTYEAVQDETKEFNGRPKDRIFFENRMNQAFSEGRRILRTDGIGSVVFAHKTTEGWEALLSGIIRGGWVITGSWPVATERGARLRARDSAALATSVHLVCRPRTEDKTGDWGEVLRELPKRVGDWMERLQSEGIRGADLVFACIGPALEIFSRYSRVETADGREVPLAEYLLKVWEVVGRTALEQVLGTAEAKARNGVAGALEEDARLTALFLWTLQSTNGEQTNGNETGSEDESDDEDEEGATSKAKPKGFSLVYDVVRRFAQPLGIHLQEWEGRIIKTEKGVVRLLSVTERAKQLFGEEGAQAVADRIESHPERSSQLTLFLERSEGAVPEIKGRGRQRKGIEVSEEKLKRHKGATTLDRVHAAMLLQASGRTNALRALLKAEVERGPDFLRLSNALSALYPKESEEKRLLDAMLLAVPK